ncbi:3-methyl-2-oxobutanoate hydroxymethyltransferase [Helicobacter sp. MIT 14-3879]|uniref:3-methyl-2-oxobutanoate hydroxymethyltransferase n=1 Tax=Helicobacter sp. MIT 14-3879 TaxID=2040649 RepID=UPI000E1EDBBD|nr:3-methyl-2-oxobutanoate hydroxymethyltransferase [Helicobacter sp. MIT 14-3879]RDU65637.1 3-methyl-2-oxobutanoate hydroxymethyltransferase [Helicobacter sp. MIT 14-3879]
MTISSFKKLKGIEKISAITAYDALFAGIFDGEVDVILVGDSLSMSFGGNDDTIPISLEAMIYHTKAVRKVTKKSLLIADMPFGSYPNINLGLKNAIKMYKQSGADAIKLEVNESKITLLKELINNGIAVMAHIGLMPQFYRHDGVYKIKGKDEAENQSLLDLALQLEEIGCFGLLIEGTKSDIATKITKNLKIPTIGIGSGSGTDGQILVWSDAFGFFNKFTPKFVRKYLDGESILKEAIKKYNADVKNITFPNENESY